jgi:hypothetical protein
MPYCKKCHNNRFFGSSKVPPAAPSANGPLSGLFADFNGQGEIASVTRMGADKKTAMAATADPQDYFDVCLRCGSQDVEW